MEEYIGKEEKKKYKELYDRKEEENEKWEKKTRKQSEIWKINIGKEEKNEDK